MKLSFEDYNKFLEDLAKTKKVELDDIKGKLANCGAPGIHNTTVRLTFLTAIVSSLTAFIFSARKGSRNGGTADRHLEVHRIKQATLR